MNENLFDIRAEHRFFSHSIYNTYFAYKMSLLSSLMVHSVKCSEYINRVVIYLDVEIHSLMTVWQFHVIQCLRSHSLVSTDYMQDRGISLYFF